MSTRKTAQHVFINFAIHAVTLCLWLQIPIIMGSTRPAFREDPPQVSGPPQAAPSSGIQIRIDANPKRATIGDPIRMDLDITVPAGYQVDLPVLDKQVGDFSIVEFAPELPAAAAQQPMHKRARIIAALYRTGTFTFPAIPVQVRTPEGKQISVSTAPVNIEITSVLSGKDGALKDLKKQEVMPEPFRWVLWLSIAAALATAGTIAWLLWKKKKRTRPSLVPTGPSRDRMDVAEEELRAFLAHGLPEQGKVKEFYVLLSDIVKRILEAGFGIHTAERTTAEIMVNLSLVSRPGSAAMERIESFLLRCDIVKFAKYIPSKEEHASACEDALETLEISRKFLVASHQPAAISGGETQ